MTLNQELKLLASMITIEDIKKIDENELSWGSGNGIYEQLGITYRSLVDNFKPLSSGILYTKLELYPFDKRTENMQVISKRVKFVIEKLKQLKSKNK